MISEDFESLMHSVTKILLFCLQQEQLSVNGLRKIYGTKNIKE